MVNPITDWQWDAQYIDYLNTLDTDSLAFRFHRDIIETVNRLIFEIELLRGVIIGAPADGLLFEGGENIFLEDGATFLVLES